MNYNHDEYVRKNDLQQTTLKEKKLKIWNGRGYAGFYNGKRLEIEHFYVCAKTQKQAIELCAKMGYTLTPREIREYWNPECWGIFMQNITPEIGLWVEMKGKPNPIRMA